MRFFSPRASYVDIGALLLRLLVVYFLFFIAYLGTLTFTTGWGIVMTIALGLNTLLCAIGGLFILLGMFTRITSIVLFIWILFLSVAFGRPTDYLTQELLLLIVFSIGAGKYALDRKIFKDKTQAV